MHGWPKTIGRQVWRKQYLIHFPCVFDQVIDTMPVLPVLPVQATRKIKWLGLGLQQMDN